MEPCVADRNQTAEVLTARGYGTLAVILGAFSVAGVVLNLLVIAITVRHRQLRQPLSYALVNLAVCDLGCALFGGLPATVSSAMGHFHLGKVGCTLEGFTVAFFGEWHRVAWRRDCRGTGYPGLGVQDHRSSLANSDVALSSSEPPNITDWTLKQFWNTLTICPSVFFYLVPQALPACVL